MTPMTRSQDSKEHLLRVTKALGLSCSPSGVVGFQGQIGEMSLDPLIRGPDGYGKNLIDFIIPQVRVRVGEKGHRDFDPDIVARFIVPNITFLVSSIGLSIDVAFLLADHGPARFSVAEAEGANLLVASHGIYPSRLRWSLS